MKFKNLKKKAKKTEFPSNSRTIPAFAKASSGKAEDFRFSPPKINSARLFGLYKEPLRVFVVSVFIAAVIIVGYDFQKNLQIKEEIDLQRKDLVRNLNFWEDFISKHQNYKDAYFQAAKLEYELGDTSKAKIYTEKGLLLDPNSEDGKKLEKFLANK